jgi:hypothetical protein
MTVDEALAIVETVLDDAEQLNDVQELIFRQCWEGRCSYEEISQLSQYNDEYIKALAAKLWKLLSEAFGEKVKKNNLRSFFKRYLRRHQITLHRTQVIGVNLSGANLSGARLSFANLSESDSSADLHGAILADYNTLSDEIIKAEDGHNQGILSNTEERIYHWNDLCFRCEEQVKIAEALDRTSVLFFTQLQSPPHNTHRATKPRTRFPDLPPRQMGYSGNIASRYSKRSNARSAVCISRHPHHPLLRRSQMYRRSRSHCTRVFRDIESGIGRVVFFAGRSHSAKKNSCCA